MKVDFGVFKHYHDLDMKEEFKICYYLSFQNDVVNEQLYSILIFFL